jgi:AcrR family transcriptional regulator
MAIAKGAASPAPRRRRRREDAQQEILQAAGELLTERPFDQVNVSAIMERTTLSRKSFYVYFQDRTDVISSLVRPLRAEADAALAGWRDSTEMVEAGRAALRSAAAAYQQHGAILRALARAAETDREAAQVWSGFIDPVVVIGAEKIAAATAAGVCQGLDPVPTARALVTMNVACLLRLRPDESPADVESLVATLSRIWERTIFLRTPAP